MSVKKSKGLLANSRCIGCNKCIAACKIQDCTARKKVDGKNKIFLDPQKCIKCGLCMRKCNHSAIEYLDDTDKFLADLKNGEPIAIAVDPSFYFVFPTKSGTALSILKQRGVSAVYNVSFGNDLAIWTYAHWIRTHKEQKKFSFISQCFSAIEYAERYHPEMLDNIIPVKTGVVCLATYLRKYCKEKRKIAYISPCIAAHDRINLKQFDGLIQYNVTFRHLMEHLANELQQYDGKLPPVTPDIGDYKYGFGSVTVVNGTLRRALEYYVGPEYPFITIPNSISVFSEMKNFKTKTQNQTAIAFLENCTLGCITGTGIDIKNFSTPTTLSAYTKKHNDILESLNLKTDTHSAEKHLNGLDNFFAGININDFIFAPKERYVEMSVIPEDVYEEIFTRMHKTTPEQRNINCQACGYLSCRQMAQAIAKGLNEIENCIQYEHFENNLRLTTDTLTRLPNLQMFFSRVENIIEEKKLIGNAVLQIHLNNLLLINEMFGFEKGTETLYEFSCKAASFLEDDEELFHANGADFFAIIKNVRVNKFLFSINHIEFTTIAKNMPDFPKVSTKCGVYVLTGNETKIDGIINCVNLAYKVAKKNQLEPIAFYHSSMNSEMIGTMSMAQLIPKALEKKEFSIMFQPKVSAKTQMLIGAEALIRWVHNGELISPGKFISIAESSGYIKQIDFFMLTEACRHISMWSEIGIESVCVSINFSKEHFTASGVVERICAIIDSYKVPHHCIEIEITETSFLDKFDNIKNGIIELRKNGIRTSLDDFGTGYSSIGLLSMLPFDVIKFDKSIMDTVKPDTRAETVVRNIIHMAKDLEMEVVAEGIDGPEKFELLKNIGCDIIQGYFFDRPLSPQDFLKRLAHPKYA